MSLLASVAKKVGPHRVFRLLSFYPPYLGAGIKVTEMTRDLSSIEVQMKLRFWNQNYVGTHFGGSIFSMCDPFFMLMLLQRLGPGFVVWDKASSIRFTKPGRGTLRARFELPDETLEAVRARATENGKDEPSFTVEVKDGEGDTVAVIEKTVYVRKKR